MFMKKLYVLKAILYEFLIQSLQNYVIQMCSTYEGWIDMTKIVRSRDKGQDQGRKIKIRLAG